MHTNLIKNIRPATVEQMEGLPVENLVDYMEYHKQYAESVINFTSRYNTSTSISYAPINLVGKYTVYPMYGDCPDTYILRSYGKWSKLREAFQKNYMPHDIDPYLAEDYVTLRFETAVIPRDISIYETYNPGAVVRIWGRYTTFTWKLLWEGAPQNCSHNARKFQPEIRKINCLINEIRVEFNQNHLRYHTSIDAVLLGGLKTKYRIQQSIFQQDLLKFLPIISAELFQNPFKETPVDEIDLFASLPYEIILHIFQYLDLKSLARSAQVNKTFNYVTFDPILYRNLSLKRYWNKVSSDSLNYFIKKCSGLKKLDLSWCGNDDKQFSRTFIEFISKCKKISHVSLCHCQFVNFEVLQKMSKCAEITELRLVDCKSENIGFLALQNLKKLITLDLSSSHICDNSLIAILMVNPNLKHLIIDICENVKQIDEIVETASNYNRELLTFSSFKMQNLSYFGAKHFKKLTKLKDLDLGWCFLLSHPGDCLDRIAKNCKDLKRLVISQWREVNDHMLEPIIQNCKELTQLDLLGIKSITSDGCEEALASLKKLQLLDISFCDNISAERVKEWEIKYPDVKIQRSCSHVVMAYY